MLSSSPLRLLQHANIVLERTDGQSMDQQRVNNKHRNPLFHASHPYATARYHPASLGYGKGTARKGQGYVSGADTVGKVPNHGSISWVLKHPQKQGG